MRGSPLLLAAGLVVASACASRLTKRHAGPVSAAELVLKQEKGSRTSLALTALEIEEDAKDQPSEPPTEPADAGEADPEVGEPEPAEPDERPPPARALIGSMSSPSTDASRFERRIVAGLLHRPFSGGLRAGAVYHPADRVVWSEVELWIPGDQPFTISGYDKVNTGYEIVDLGKLSRTTDLSLGGSADVSASLGDTRSKTTDAQGSTREIARGLAGNASAAASASETLQEEVQLRQRYVTLAASVEQGGKALRLVREGAYGIDLTGAVTVDTSFRASAMVTTQIFALTATPRADGSDAVSIVRRVEVVPRVNKLRVCGFATSVIRNVERRLHTIRESDDHVAFQHSKTKVAWMDIELERRFAFKVTISYPSTPKGQSEGSPEARAETLWLRSATVAPQQATFATDADAQRIAGWISANAGGLAGFAAFSGGFQLLGEGGVPLPPLGKGAMVLVEDFALDGDPTPLPSCDLRPIAP
jgi:hypothetical protein